MDRNFIFFFFPVGVKKTIRKDGKIVRGEEKKMRNEKLPDEK
jgi:hypothetical protein